MSNLQELDDKLAVAWPQELWDEHGITAAIPLIRLLNSDEWNALGSVWETRPADWQGRLAQLVQFGEAQSAVPLLMKMLEADDQEVILRAADALCSLGSHGIRLAPAMLERLRSLAGSQTSSIDAFRIKRFLEGASGAGKGSEVD